MKMGEGIYNDLKIIGMRLQKGKLESYFYITRHSWCVID